MDEKEMKAELAEAEKLMNAKKQEADKLRKKIESSAPYKKAEKLYKETDKKRDILYDKINKIEGDLWAKFVSDGAHCARYTRGGYWSGNNIYPEVISAIGNHIKIGRLRGSDIEKVVRKLVDILALKSDIPKLKREKDKAYELHDVAWQKKMDLMRPVENLEREFVKLKDRVTELKNELTKPKHYVVQTERSTERDKVDNPDIIMAIFKEVFK